MMERIYHTWDEWECYPSGFYEERAPNGMTTDEAEEAYRSFLSNIPLFERVMDRVLKEWPNSCEHYLTNEKMNRIAWMGQAAMCLHTGIPSRFKGGYNLLTEEQQEAANDAALLYINKWMVDHGYETYTHETIKSRTDANIY